MIIMVAMLFTKITSRFSCRSVIVKFSVSSMILSSTMLNDTQSGDVEEVSTSVEIWISLAIKMREKD